MSTNESDVCEFGYNDCQNHGVRCYLCVNALHYQKTKLRKKPAFGVKAKKSARTGSIQEFRNSVENSRILSGTTSRQTPNSGAGQVKGDEQISGLVTVMEELKTRVSEKAIGKKSFTIHREWLDKLRAEALAANKEFYYLKFSFHELDNDMYVIVDQEMIMGMVYTLAEDRKKVRLAQLDLEIALRRNEVVTAENVLLLAKNNLLESELKKASQFNGPQ